MMSFFFLSVSEICKKSNVQATFSVKSGSFFLARMTTPNVKFCHFEILLWILPRFYPRETMRCIRGKLLPLPTSFGDSSDSVLSGPQSVSCQYAASRTYLQRTRVCDPTYVAHVERVVSASRFGDSAVSSCIRYEIIASVRYTKLLLRDSALKYINLISFVVPRHDLSSIK